MTDTVTLINQIESGDYDKCLLELYADEEQIAYQKERYKKAIQAFVNYFGEGEVEIYSAPGRSEIGGNHTDHQHGEVLAASINKDAIAIVKPLDETTLQVVSGGYDMITLSLDNLAMKEEEKESTLALLKGVLAGVKQRGYRLGGFQAYITSDVLIGAGLSSSAAYETLMGTILSGLYNNMGISPLEIAIIGQYAENVYFGKPCGLMDQMACSVGNLVHIDFAKPDEPKVEKVDFDFNKAGYSLCITDTKGSHADLTADYAAVPEEMKAVAEFFGKKVLLEVSREQLIDKMAQVRAATGDRAVLRALHFVCENVRVQKEVETLKQGRVNEFFDFVKTSGDSSFKYLQNVYSNHDVQHQNVSLALALSDMFLGENGVSRVHGGGFAGTIQAFVKNEAVTEYQKKMDDVFGKDSCSVLKIRKYGGIKVF
ncbi:MAG: galactokinase [Lachnospiraceae bacterium]|nr:galactokinase [Lachnospiraceae bacterium]